MELASGAFPINRALCSVVFVPQPNETVTQVAASRLLLLLQIIRRKKRLRLQSLEPVACSHRETLRV
jgi:hypothetical protein